MHQNNKMFKDYGSNAIITCQNNENNTVDLYKWIY